MINMILDMISPIITAKPNETAEKTFGITCINSITATMMPAGKINVTIFAIK